MKKNQRTTKAYELKIFYRRMFATLLPIFDSTFVRHFVSLNKRKKQLLIGAEDYISLEMKTISESDYILLD